MNSFVSQLRAAEKQKNEKESRSPCYNQATATRFFGAPRLEVVQKGVTSYSCLVSPETIGHSL